MTGHFFHNGMAEWVTPEDAERFYTDMMVYGLAYKIVESDGRAKWVPLDDATTAQRAEGGEE